MPLPGVRLPTARCKAAIPKMIVGPSTFASAPARLSIRRTTARSIWRATLATLAGPRTHTHMSRKTVTECTVTVILHSTIPARHFSCSAIRSLPRAIPLPTSSPTREAPAPVELLPLPRSIPHRRALLLLSVPVPPTSWPSHLEIASSLIAATSAKLKASGIAVHVSYDGLGQATTFDNRDQAEETYKARLFWPNGTVRTYGQFDLELLNSEELQRDLAYQPTPWDGSDLDPRAAGTEGQKEILVCTHGSRDCRCSDRGGPLVLALREEIQRRGLEKEVRVGEVAHVGGHKYAANALLLPSLDMLSNLTLEHAPALIHHLLDPRPRPSSSRLWAHWRGRIGLSEAHQAELWARVDPDLANQSVPSSCLEGVDGQNESVESGQGQSHEVELTFKTFQGDDKVVKARLGQNLLDVGKENGLPSLEGVCEGNLECATCHLYLFPPPTSSSSSTSAPAPVSEPSEEELDMLGYALGYRDESRLGCQIKVSKELGEWCSAGGVIGLPKY